MFLNVTFLGCGDNTPVKMENVLVLRSVLKYLGIEVMMSSITKRFMCMDVFGCVLVEGRGKRGSKCGKM